MQTLSGGSCGHSHSPFEASGAALAVPSSGSSRSAIGQGPSIESATQSGSCFTGLFFLGSESPLMGSQSPSCFPSLSLFPYSHVFLDLTPPSSYDFLGVPWLSVLISVCLYLCVTVFFYLFLFLYDFFCAITDQQVERGFRRHQTPNVLVEKREWGPNKGKGPAPG